MNLSRELLFESFGGQIISDHRSSKRHDLLHSEKVTLKPPSSQKCDGPSQAMTSDPERPLLGLLCLVHRSKQWVPDHGERVQKASMKSRTDACCGEVRSALSFRKDQVVICICQ